METMYVMAQPKTKLSFFKKLLTKLCFKNHFIQCWSHLNKRRDLENNTEVTVSKVPALSRLGPAQAPCSTRPLGLIPALLICVKSRSTRAKRVKHPETNKSSEDNTFRNVLDPKLYTKEFLEDQLVWLGIAGLGDQLFDILTKAFCLKFSHMPRKVRGMLLYGPPGCGKTVLARHFSKFLPAKEPLLIDARIMGAKNGDQIRRARSFFNRAIADEKKYGAKSDIYVVVLDAMISSIQTENKTEKWNDDCEELIEQLLRLMDGPDALNNLFVIATTDRIDLVEKSMLRRGKFELLVKLDYPTEKQRLQILDMFITDLRDDYLLDGDVNVQELAMLTEGCTSSSLHELVYNRAFVCAFTKNKHSDLNLRYRMEDFIMAADEIRCRDVELK